MDELKNHQIKYLEWGIICKVKKFINKLHDKLNWDIKWGGPSVKIWNAIAINFFYEVK